MKRISRLRKKLKNRRWLENKLDELYEETNKCANFRTFDCSDFFRGYRLAERNTKKYEIWSDRLDRQIAFIEKCIKRLMK